jgi:cytochrome c2
LANNLRWEWLRNPGSGSHGLLYFRLGKGASITVISLVALVATACSGGDTPGTSTQIPTESIVANTVLSEPTTAPTATATSSPSATPIPEPEVAASATQIATSTTVPLPDPTATVIPTPVPTVAATATATVVTPTATTAPVESTATPVLPTATNTPAPTATSVPVEPTPTPGIVINQALADEGAATYSSSCTGCHSTGSNSLIGPGHKGVYERAKTRVEGLSAEEYLTQSIRSPSAFVVPGYMPLMPRFNFNDDKILALIEYLKSL